MTPAVRAAALSKTFGRERAVESVSFEARPGELFGLVGPDGAGKSTLLRMLAGVLRPTSGDAEIFGASVARDPERVKTEIAYMSQRFGLYSDLTVAENLDFYADLYEVPRGERAVRLERLFQFSSLKPFSGRLAGKLSGGMKQKLGLSCALIHEPRLLLLDEPTFGVDPISRRDLWLMVHEMVARGVTAVVSTAYLDEAERFDRLLLLHRGRILDSGTPDELLGRIEGEILDLRVTPLREARTILLRHPSVLRVAIFGDRLHVSVRSASRDRPALEAALRERGVAIHEISPIAPTLEDRFIEAVERAEAA
ncbi:MAG: ATP-binding cassette domain-containing protein [Vicinamibacteria bacterium]